MDDIPIKTAFLDISGSLLGPRSHIWLVVFSGELFAKMEEAISALSKPNLPRIFLRLKTTI